MKKNYISALVMSALSVLVIQRSTAQIDSRSLSFDGSTQIVTVPDNAAYQLGTNAFTIECWIKAGLTQTMYPMAISKRPIGSAFSGFGFGIDNFGKVWIQINGSNYIPGFGADLRDNACHHIATARVKGPSNDTLKFYLDGAFLGIFNMASSYTITASGPLYIGGDLANSANNMYKGNVSEVRFWNYARTAAQISANKGTEISGSTTGLIGYWRLNEGTGQTVMDRSSIANNGVLGGTTSVESTDPVWSTSCGITGVENYSVIDDHIKLYPNPTSSILNVTGISEKTTVTLYDVTGRLIMTTETDMNITIDSAPLQQGIYLVTTESKKGRSFSRVIVQK